VINETAGHRDLECLIEENEVGCIHLEPEDLRTPLRHLVRNACEAMPGGGTLRVRTKRTRSTIRITIADTGPGIPPDILPRLGEPFVTTKPPGRGLGLGVCESLLRLDRHGGSLEVTQTGPEGTTVVVSLPAERGTSAP
jgi:signal transduction histidine kinase